MNADTGSCLLQDEAATLAAARQLAAGCASGGLIYLEGDLGAGKTTFCRGMIRQLGITGPVKSPTYSLVEFYPSATVPVCHFDLYRMEDPEELEYIGFRDYFSAEALCLVEWPEKAGGLLPAPDLNLSLVIDGLARRLKWRVNSPKGRAILAHWQRESEQRPR